MAFACFVPNPGGADALAAGVGDGSAFQPTIQPSVSMPYESSRAFDIGGEPVYGPARGLQQLPAVAFDGMNYLVVWGDDRTGFDESATVNICGARVSTEGVVLDPTGIVISTTGGYESAPAVAFDGKNFLVVWQGNHKGVTGIYAARVSAGGVAVDAKGIAISTGASAKTSPAVAFDGKNFIVAWTDAGASDFEICDIHGARVSARGILLDNAEIVISNADYDQRAPAVAFDGENYLVVWHEEPAAESEHIGIISGARLTPRGIVLDTSRFTISLARRNATSPSVAFDGKNYLVTWQEEVKPFDPDNFWDIYGARVSTGGVVLDSGGIPVSAAMGEQSSPRVAFDDKDYFVVWEDSRGQDWDIYGARVTPTGAVLDSGGIVISGAAGNQGSPALDFSGANCLVLWEDGRRGPSSNIRSYGGGDIPLADIYGARVNVRGVPLDTAGICVSAAGGTKQYPRAAFEGRDYFVVWQEEIRGACDVYGARVTAEGSLLDKTVTAISTEMEDERFPAVAAGPSSAALVVYQRLMPLPRYGVHRIWARFR